MRRYTHIVCDTHEVAVLAAKTYPARRGYDKWIPSCTMLPLLPSLLAGCALTAQLFLHVQCGQGKPFASTTFGNYFQPQEGGPRTHISVPCDFCVFNTAA